jgi:hypothetical protein
MMAFAAPGKDQTELHRTHKEVWHGGDEECAHEEFEIDHEN